MRTSKDLQGCRLLRGIHDERRDHVGHGPVLDPLSSLSWCSPQLPWCFGAIWTTSGGQARAPVIGSFKRPLSGRTGMGRARRFRPFAVHHRTAGVAPQWTLSLRGEEPLFMPPLKLTFI